MKTLKIILITQLTIIIFPFKSKLQIRRFSHFFGSFPDGFILKEGRLKLKLCQNKKDQCFLGCLFFNPFLKFLISCLLQKKKDSRNEHPYYLKLGLIYFVRALAVYKFLRLVRHMNLGAIYNRICDF